MQTRNPDLKTSVPQRRSPEVVAKLRRAAMGAAQREVIDRVAMGLPLLVTRSGEVCGPGMARVEIRTDTVEMLTGAL